MRFSHANADREPAPIDSAWPEAYVIRSPASRVIRHYIDKGSGWFIVYGLALYSGKTRFSAVDLN